ncbi:hypothetical protein AVEN_185207-1 [Araneus ventricosus]|uniref:Uncharacterized protein n=1 Tax=Araneus ventricosus TaxID=182803 RepID=A0A4Y2S902_ARAVE|nr:hypothetical protein AVEN_185207-1 [Araneus ventricosus]
MPTRMSSSSFDLGSKLQDPSPGSLPVEPNWDVNITKQNKCGVEVGECGAGSGIAVAGCSLPENGTFQRPTAVLRDNGASYLKTGRMVTLHMPRHRPSPLMGNSTERSIYTHHNLRSMTCTIFQHVCRDMNLNVGIRGSVPGSRDLV